MNGGAITFHLPIRTQSETNAHEHWRVKAKRTKEHRVAASIFIRQWAEDLPPKPWRLTLCRIAPRRLDTGNLAASMKAVQDGLCDAIGINDGDEAHAWRYTQRRGEPKEYAVKITIEPMGAGKPARK